MTDQSDNLNMEEFRKEDIGRYVDKVLQYLNDRILIAG